MGSAKTFEATKVTDYKVLKISSNAFPESGAIPSKYTCDGDDINPPIHIEGIPEEAKALPLLLMISMRLTEISVIGLFGISRLPTRSTKEKVVDVQE